MAEDNVTTVYNVTIIHEHRGRRAVIQEMLYGRWPKVVADFVCVDSNESDWLMRHGKHPWLAYRSITAVSAEDGSFDEITMHPPGSYPVTVDLGDDNNGVPL